MVKITDNKKNITNRKNKTDVMDLTVFSKEELIDILDLADDVKKNPDKYRESMKYKTLMMIFEKPSLRTRLSFEVGMTQMGGHAIYYNTATSPMGKKESIADTARTASRFVEIIMARLFKHEHNLELARYATVPVINALDDYSHPCQILADLQTIREKKGKLKGLKLAYFGDGYNNVTHSLMFACSILGIDISVGSPSGKEYSPRRDVYEKCIDFAKKSGSKVIITDNAVEAVKDADVIYTDSWMSYHIPDDQKEERIKIFMPYQVNSTLLKHAKKDVIFMNCLPAIRGMEQTEEVIDGPHSVVFDEAENRLHAQKALMLRLLKLA